LRGMEDQTERARMAPVEAGHRNPTEAEITQRLEPSALVVLHLANDLKDGACVTSSESATGAPCMG